MKKLILSLILISICSFVNAQTTAVAAAKTSEISNAEKFSDRAGALIQKEFITIGTIKKCDIQVMYFTDLISNQKQSAVRFEYEYKSSYTSDTKVAMLDADEVEGLIKSIRLLQTTIASPTVPTNYTEIAFKSRSGFSTGCFSKSNTWSSFLKLEKFDSNSYVWIDNTDLPTLLTILEEAQKKM